MRTLHSFQLYSINSKGNNLKEEQLNEFRRLLYPCKRISTKYYCIDTVFEDSDIPDYVTGILMYAESNIPNAPMPPQVPYCSLTYIELVSNFKGKNPKRTFIIPEEVDPKLPPINWLHQLNSYKLIINEHT